MNSFAIIRDASTNVVPLSECKCKGRPLRDTKRLNAARNVDVERSVVASKCIASVEKQTNTQRNF